MPDLGRRLHVGGAHRQEQHEPFSLHSPGLHDAKQGPKQEANWETRQRWEQCSRMEAKDRGEEGWVVVIVRRRARPHTDRILPSNQTPLPALPEPTSGTPWDR